MDARFKMIENGGLPRTEYSRQVNLFGVVEYFSYALCTMLYALFFVLAKRGENY